MFEKQLNTVPEFHFLPEWNPEGSEIRALTYEGMPYKGSPTRVFAYYGKPAGAGPFPAVLLCHGGGGHAFWCWVKMWNDRGFAAIAMDTTGYFPGNKNAGSREGDGECWTRSPLPELLPGGFVCGPDNTGNRDCEDLPPEDHWLYHALSDLFLAHGLLESFPEIDRKRIGLTGISWGGILTSLAIGWDFRLSFAIPVYGSGYMPECVGLGGQSFQHENVRKYWLAENRFSEVHFPVLWQCWDDDPFFCLDCNTRSWQDTENAGAPSSLSILHDMNHSHYHSWIRPEPYLFAEAVCGLRPELPKIKVRRENYRVTVDAPEARCTLYTISAPITYSVHDSAYGNRFCMNPVWKETPVNASTIQLPGDTRGWYIKAAWTVGEEEYVLSGPFEAL